MSWIGKVKDVASFLKTLPPGKEVKILVEKTPFEKSVEKGAKKTKKESFYEPLPPMEPEELEKGGEGRTSAIEMLIDEENEQYFMKKLKSILRDNLYLRQESGKRSGSLDHRKLYKIKLSDRLFTKKGALRGKEYNLVIAIDCSGSMSGAKMNSALLFLRKLFKVLHKECNLAIVAFNTLTETLKRFDEKIDHKELDRRIEEEIVDRIFRSKYTGGNHDHLAIRMAADLLRKKKGKKLIVILSDGQPACGCGFSINGVQECRDAGFLIQKLHEEVKKTENEGVQILGISILYTPSREFYNYGAVVENVKQLYGVVLRELSKIIKRRH